MGILCNNQGVISPKWNSTATVLSGSPGHVGLVVYKDNYIAVVTFKALFNSFLPGHNGGISDDNFKYSFVTENWLVFFFFELWGVIDEKYSFV